MDEEGRKNSSFTSSSSLLLFLLPLCLLGTRGYYILRKKSRKQKKRKEKKRKEKNTEERKKIGKSFPLKQGKNFTFFPSTFNLISPFSSNFQHFFIFYLQLSSIPDFFPILSLFAIHIRSIFQQSVLHIAQGYDFFYLVLQWPVAICKTKASCCYSSPTSDFTIRGLRPFNIDGSSPVNCNNSDHFNVSKISDLKSRMQRSWPYLSCEKNGATEFWSRAWKQEGTCSEYDQHKFFKIGLDFKDKLNLLQVLKKAGINPDGKLYESSKVEDVIREAFGYEAGLICSFDSSGKEELSKVFICIDTTGTKVIDCPGLPDYGQCSSMIKFTAF